MVKRAVVIRTSGDTEMAGALAAAAALPELKAAQMRIAKLNCELEDARAELDRAREARWRDNARKLRAYRENAPVTRGEALRAMAWWLISPLIVRESA